MGLSDFSYLGISDQEILGREMDCEREVNGKIWKYLKDMEREIESENVNMKKKWTVLRLKMDEYEACLCKSSWVSVFGPPFTHFSAFAPPSGLSLYLSIYVYAVMIEITVNTPSTMSVFFPNYGIYFSRKFNGTLF